MGSVVREGTLVEVGCSNVLKVVSVVLGGQGHRDRTLERAESSQT